MVIHRKNGTDAGYVIDGTPEDIELLCKIGLEELQNTKDLTNIVLPGKKNVLCDVVIPDRITEENLDDFIYRKSSILIESGMDVLESLRHTALAGADAVTLMSYAKLMGSVTKSIDTLNKINLQKRKENITREMKKLEQEGPPQTKDSTTNIQNQTVYVTTREDIMKSLLDQAGKIVDTTVFVEGQDPGYISDSNHRP